ncbi:VOC family protein [Streptomyces albofaciens JCM 4342]|uniref:VOC family protein n=1 Tax=Streptomyces albofaciens TaxID=66866 RepID=UPI00123C421E|nr:VOC family protein [Streptomyces albofaciens]KAA6214512.1 VOC family protein [Streptomyces albofaciens JCM 4342]
MNFVSIRVITDDVARLVGFYERVTGVRAAWATPEFAELRTPACTLAIAGSRTVALFGEGTARAAANRSVIIEFRVPDVDAEHRRLSALGHTFVQHPTTMPWGNRSLLLRDPDGNLVNLFTPVTEDAVRRQERPAGGADTYAGSV